MDIRGFFEGKKLKDLLSKRLTRREVEILSLYASGFTVKEIAEILNVSESTISSHSIFRQASIGFIRRFLSGNVTPVRRECGGMLSKQIFLLRLIRVS